MLGTVEPWIQAPNGCNMKHRSSTVASTHKLWGKNNGTNLYAIFQQSIYAQVDHVDLDLRIQVPTRKPRSVWAEGVALWTPGAQLERMSKESQKEGEERKEEPGQNYFKLF